MTDPSELPDASHSLERLTHISTLWSVVHQAHHGAGSVLTAAQSQLLERYGGAAHRYRLGALRDPEAADELFQEFTVRFLSGGFKNADPGRGRFRDFIKTALYHLIVDYQRRQRHRLPSLDTMIHDAADPAAGQARRDQEFLTSWREQLMDHTWLALESCEQQTGQPHYTILRCRSEQPLLSSAELANMVSARLNKPYSVHSLRQALHRAREHFTDLLLEEVAQSLDKPDQEALEQELADLGLLTYCQAALERRGAR